MASGEHGAKPSPGYAATSPSEHRAAPSPASWMLASSWQSTLVVGVLTLILGIIVSFHPTGSLNVVAVLFGVLMILSGIFHLIRVLQ